jgi:hypothetical protein
VVYKVVGQQRAITAHQGVTKVPEVTPWLAQAQRVNHGISIVSIEESWPLRPLYLPKARDAGQLPA